MRKRRSFDRLFEGNMLVVFCVLFTAAVILSAIINTIFGAEFTLSMRNIIVTAVFLSAPLLPLSICKHLLKANYITERDYLFWIGIPIHYFVSAGITMFYSLIWSIFEQIPPIVFLTTLIEFTVMYAIVIGGAVVVDFCQTSTANKNLRKIQASQNNDSE